MELLMSLFTEMLNYKHSLYTDSSNSFEFSEITSPSSSAQTILEKNVVVSTESILQRVMVDSQTNRKVLADSKVNIDARMSTLRETIAQAKKQTTVHPNENNIEN
jgi:hypothetical protein